VQTSGDINIPADETGESGALLLEIPKKSKTT
jgi:hypothetical protein